MTSWLTGALADSATVVTANRRLARRLREEYGATQVAIGRLAWRSPALYSWQDWLEALFASADNPLLLPTRINAHQSQVLWERCLRRELGDSLASMANLVRLSRDTWQRLADWQIPLADAVRAAQNADQRMFAAAAGRYEALLRREQWVDDAGLAARVLTLIERGQVSLGGKVTFVGFNRQRPIADSLQAAMVAAGVAVQEQRPANIVETTTLRAFDNPDHELRVAGRWARDKVEAQPNARVAVIAQGLEQEADRASRLFREGFAPGWQYGPGSLASAVNVSYGRKLSEYPAIATALLVLRWLVRDLPAGDVAVLLRSPLLASGDLPGRSRLELRLRQLADRDWSPSMITAALRGKDEETDASDWLLRVAALSKRRREVTKQASPAEWAVFIDESLRIFNWPGEGTQDSVEFQLLNRWRELLNELARLDLVTPRMALSTALSRLATMASDTLFQAEAPNAVVSLMGPLEASGAEFDAIWICGLSSSQWPPPGSPAVLLSRRLQQRHRMPDSAPDDTRQYAERLLQRLTTCATEVVCSYPLQADDTEQTAASALAHLPLDTAADNHDPGWNAAQLVSRGELLKLDDPVLPVSADEKLYGGAGTLQRQLSEPFAAFVFGRLGVSLLYPQSVGISPLLRGNVIHDALYQLYAEKPSSAELRSWGDDELTRRIAAAVDFACLRHERQADKVLLQLLRIERERVSRLLRAFVAQDAQRTDFQVLAVEGQLEFVAGAVRLELRCDRIDQLSDGSIEILDYKTGARKRLLRNREEVSEVQLFVYALAVDDPVAALALVNVDSREIGFDGAGRGYTDEAQWPELLQRVTQLLYTASDELQAGDVRVNAAQSVKDGRALNVLSRFTELRRER